MIEMEIQQAHQQRKRCWLVFGRALLTLSVLGLITVGLYLISQRVHDGPAVTENPEEFNARERRDLRGRGVSEDAGVELSDEKLEQILYKNEIDRPVRSLKKKAYTVPDASVGKGAKRVNQVSDRKSANSVNENSDDQVADGEDFYDVANNSTELIYDGDIDLHNQTDYEEKIRQKKDGYPMYEHYVYVTRYKCSKKPHWHRVNTELRKFA